MICRDERTGAVCRIVQHSSGLEIRVMEMPEFKTASAQFAARFGSQYLSFRTSPDGAVTQMPEGIAHYLEHKLFENEDNDASELFAQLGAHDNAYTDTDRTVYYFQTARAVEDALRVLLNFVLHPFFTKESVEKERGIILQELQEALDDPADRLMMQLLQGLYHAHPVRHHVLGTAKSIRRITPELLYDCWRTFYNPRNMVLCCAGNLTAEQVLRIADELLPPAPPFTAELLLPPEPETVCAKKLSRRMAVGRTQFMIGFRCDPLCGEERLRETLLCALVIEILAGDTSPLYLRLLDAGLLNDAVATDCFAGDGWFTVTAEGESEQPEAVCAALCEEIARAKIDGLDAERFAVCKKAAYGDALLGLNTPEAAADAMTDAFILGMESPFARTELLAAATLADAQACLARCFRTDRITLSVIAPEEDPEERKNENNGNDDAV